MMLHGWPETDDLKKMLLEQVGSFARAEIAPKAKELDETARFPTEIVKKLGAVFNEVYKEKEIRELNAKVGLHVENLDPEAAKQFVDAEQKKWSEVAKAANIVPK